MSSKASHKFALSRTNAISSIRCKQHPWDLSSCFRGILVKVPLSATYECNRQSHDIIYSKALHKRALDLTDATLFMRCKKHPWALSSFFRGVLVKVLSSETDECNIQSHATMLSKHSLQVHLCRLMQFNSLAAKRIHELTHATSEVSFIKFHLQFTREPTYAKVIMLCYNLTWWLDTTKDLNWCALIWQKY